MKRIISLVAVVAMVFSLCALNVSAKNEKIQWTQEYTYSETVAPGGQIVFEIADVITVTEAGYIWDACICSSLSFDAENLEFVSIDGVGDDYPLAVSRDKVDLEYSEFAFDHAYSMFEQEVGTTTVGTYTLTFQVPATAEIGTTYDFQIYYGANAANLCSDAAGTHVVDPFELMFEGNPLPAMTVTVAEEAVEEPAVAPTAAEQAVRLGCEACGVAAGVRFISSIDTAAAGDGLEGYGIEITYNGVTKDVPAVNTFKTEGNVVYFTAVITNAPAGATFVAQPYAKYADGKVYATAGANA